MKLHTLATISTSALAILVAAAPIAALAHDDVSVTANSDGSSVSASVNVSGDNSGKGGSDGAHPLLRATGILGRIASSTLHLGKGKGEDKNGTTTHDNAGKGGDGTKRIALGTKEIDNRIAKLNAAITRINGTEKLSAGVKASLVAGLSAQVTALTDLKTKIGTEGTTTLKDDVQSITKSYRTYALVLPQAAITAAADRVMTIVGQMETLETKLTDRIALAQTAGANVSAAQTANADFTAKVADAKVQAQAAASAVAGLKADNGDDAIRASNTAALKAAGDKLKVAETDLKAARADVTVILKAVAGKGEVKASASATSS